jgi:uncharacterized integral membrane protein|tara:strand:+ start:41 stop:283 length:243 start_codon:yes stop_codon:yes gene_type:complete
MKKDITKIIASQLQDKKDPRFTYWLLVPGIFFSIIWSLWITVNHTENQLSIFLSNLFWPGIIIFSLTSIIAIMGWQLDID